jgi:tetratricopeptide (TPR) repeat protein
MTGNQENFQKAMDQGHTAAWDQEWNKAAGFYRNALEESPDHPLATASLGMALLEMQQYNEALVCYQRAAQLSPDDPLPLENISFILEKMSRNIDAVNLLLQATEMHLKRHDIDKAVKTLKHACKIQPDFLLARTRLAVIYDRIGRKQDALQEYLVAASMLQKNGDIAKALQVAEYCIQIQPENAEARQALSMLRTNQALPRPTRHGRGTAPLHRAESLMIEEPPPPNLKSLDPISEARQTALSQIADLLFSQEDALPAIVQVNRRGINALTMGKGGQSAEQADQARINLHLGQAIESQLQGDENQTSEELNRAVELGLQEPAVFFDLALLLVNRKPQEALQHLQKSVKSPVFAMASYLLIGKIYQETKSWTDAAVAYLQALRIADSITVPEQQAEELKQLYEPIIGFQAQVKDSTAQKNLCDIITKYLIQIDWREHLVAARKQLPIQSSGNLTLPLADIILETSSSSVIAALAHIRQLASENIIKSAMEEAYYALQYAPTYLPLHAQIGDLLVSEGRMPDAVEKFMLVAELYDLRGESSQAIRFLHRALQLAPMELKVRNRLIEVLIAQDRTDEAAQQYIDLGDIYYRLTELDMARGTYTAGINLVKKSPNYRNWASQILYKIADIDMQRLDLRQAIKVFEQIRTVDPEDIGARAYLVELHYRLGEDNAAFAETDDYTTLLENSGKRAKAIEFLNATIEEQPTHFKLRKRLADALARDGQETAAIEELDRIADTMLTNGDKDGAITMLEAIIHLNPPNVDDYRYALAHI